MTLDAAAQTRKSFKFEKDIFVIDTEKPTKVIAIEYQNRLFVSIFFSGKFGSVIEVSEKQESTDQPSVLSIKTLFGKDEPYLEIFVRNLAEKLRSEKDIKKSLLVTIGIPQDQLNKDTLKRYEKAILELF